jgi:hypothetical protein
MAALTLVVLAGGLAWLPLDRSTSGTVPAAAGGSGVPCGPMDVALVLDTSTSMDGAIEGVTANIQGFSERIAEVSGGDYRIGLIDFGYSVTVHAPFAPSNATQIQQLVPMLRQTNNSGDPEASDVALATAVGNRPASAVPDGVQEGDFTVPWRDGVSRLIVLVTDARPAGTDDDFDAGVDDAALDAAARNAQTQGITLGTFFVPNGREEPDASFMLENAAELGGGPYFATTEDGANLGQGLELLVAGCGADTDGDGLFDLWEEEGYDADRDGTVDVDLPAMGADPQRRDLFVHVDWMQRTALIPCVRFFCPTILDSSHAPSTRALRAVIEAFSEAPTENPDGSTGISLHIDAGPLTPDESGIAGGLRLGGPLPVHVDQLATPVAGSETGAVDISPFTEIRSEHLPPGRSPIFTYALYGHDVAGFTGLATGRPSDGFMLADSARSSVPHESLAFMHELGHTLGLGHGGGDDVNGKPNYLSIMNYAFENGDGLATEGGPVLDYSRWLLAPLDEIGGLDEPGGLATSQGGATVDPGVDDPPEGHGTFYFCESDQAQRWTDQVEIEQLDDPVDWDCDGDATEEGVTATVHAVTFREGDPIPLAEGETCGPVSGARTVLCSHDDWANLSFTGGQRGGLEGEGDPVLGESTEEDYEAAERAHSVGLAGPDRLLATPDAGLVNLSLVVENTGVQDDTYTVEVSAAGDWDAEPISSQSSVEVDAGESVPLTVTVDLDGGRSGDVAAVTTALTSEALESVVGERVTSIELGEDAAATEEVALTIDGSPASAGDVMTVEASGFVDGSVAVAVDDEGTPFGQAIVDPSGDTSISFEVPALDVGEHTLHLFGDGQDGVLVGEDTFEVVDPEAGAEPVAAAPEPDDGGGSGPLLLVLALLVVALAGVATAVFWWRRSRATTTSGF